MNKFANYRKQEMSDLQEFKSRVFEMARSRYNQPDLIDSVGFPHYSLQNGTTWFMATNDTWIVGFLPGN